MIPADWPTLARVASEMRITEREVLRLVAAGELDLAVVCGTIRIPPAALQAYTLLHSTRS